MQLGSLMDGFDVGEIGTVDGLACAIEDVSCWSASSVVKHLNDALDYMKRIIRDFEPEIQHIDELVAHVFGLKGVDILVRSVTDL
jgi:hypothetical protein